MWRVLKAAFNGWNLNKVPRLSAALSYYTIFSLAPLIVIATAIASWVLGAGAVNVQVKATLEGFVGKNGAEAIQGMVTSAARHGSGTIATVLGIIMLVVGATGVFLELQSALNAIWEVEPKPDRGIKGVLRDRLFSAGLVIATGFLLLVSLLLSAVLSGIGKFLSNALPGSELLWMVVNGIISFVVVSFMFALIFKYLPDVIVRWKDVLVGALVTGALFTLGKALIGAYLGRSAVASAYGAAGSLAVVLLWIYYVAQIVFFGAEFTKSYAMTLGAGAHVDESIAVPIKADTREAEEQVGEESGQPRPEARGRAATSQAAQPEMRPPAKRDTRRERR